MALGIFTRTAKEYYERISNSLRTGKQGIDKLLFSTPDIDLSAAFSLDKLVVSPHGVAFRNPGEQSAVREYLGGTGEIIEVPRTSEKTGITERMRDAVIVGNEELSSQAIQEASLVAQIIAQHQAAHYATKCKLAIDVIRTGKFSPVGMSGFDLDLEVDFSRDGDQTITYDFTEAGAGIDTALGALYDAFRDAGGSAANMVMVLGGQWLKELEDDSTVIERMQANAVNTVIEMNMIPPELQNVQDLYLIGRYRIPGKSSPVWLCTYDPEDKYTEYKGATAAAFFPSDEAICFGLNSKRYRVFRGVDVLGDSGKAERAVGDLVFDTYTEKDPVQTWLRSQTRFIYVPANVDHTAISTGTFSES